MQSELGDVVYVELPEVGKTFKQGETFGVVESVKAASDVYAPVGGEVVEVNTTLTDKPATVGAEMGHGPCAWGQLAMHGPAQHTAACCAAHLCPVPGCGGCR